MLHWACCGATALEQVDGDKSSGGFPGAADSREAVVVDVQLEIAAPIISLDGGPRLIARQVPISEIDIDWKDSPAALEFSTAESPRDVQLVESMDADGIDITHLQPVGETGEPILDECRKLGTHSDCQTEFLLSPPPEAVLGRGAFGIVWRAKHKRSLKCYAVKTLQAGSPIQELLAKRECDVAKKVSAVAHPCLTNIFASITLAEDLHCILMETCSKQDLWQVLLEGYGDGYRPRAEVQQWVGELFLGLEHLHYTADIVMCDLKPQNVLFDIRGCAKLSDFGLAREGAFEQTGGSIWNVRAGTPGYCAPEQILQEACSAATDLYSLAVLTWVMLTGGFADVDRHGRPCPRPPLRNMGKGTPSPEDWKFLQQCINQPAKAKVAPLTAAAKEFALRLVHKDPAARAGHAHLRQSSYLAPMVLPAFGACTQEVEDWVAGLARHQPQQQRSDKAAGFPVSCIEGIKQSTSASASKLGRMISVFRKRQQ